MSFLYRAFGAVLYFLYSMVHNYGFAIILFTILVKLLLLPLNIRSTNQMREMQALGPVTQYLDKKYRNNPDKKNRMVTNLYQIYHVNPLGGCLPLLLQLPVIYALFGALRDPAQYVFVYGGSEAMNQSFFWIPNLANPDPYYVLPILCVIFTFLTSKFNETVNAANQDSSTAGTSKMMLYFMPLMIGYLALNFPAGIALYWVVQNIFTFLQQVIMLSKPVKTIPIDEAMRKLDEYERNKRKEIKVQRNRERQMRSEYMGMTDNKKKNTQKQKPSVKKTPVKKTTKNSSNKRKTITKIPERKD